MRYILSTSDVNTHGIDQLVNPIDKQNVPLATDFLLTLNDALGKDNLSSASFCVAALAEELKMMPLIFNGMLCLYAFVKDSIEDQLKKVLAADAICFTRRIQWKAVSKSVICKVLFINLSSR